MAKGLMQCLKNPKIIFFGLGKWGFFRWIPDKIYIQMAYRIAMKKKLDLKAPETFNEKLQWLKLYDRKPEYTTMVDKHEVKQHIAEKIGPEYVIPTLGVWNRFEDIDFDSLPKQFVLKCTHNSGSIVICQDKSMLDKELAGKKLSNRLKLNYYWGNREWPYKNVKPRILAETYMQDGDKQCLPVYKVFNFNGEPRIIQAIQNDKTENETIDYFDTQWNLLPLRQNYPNSTVPLEKPEQLEQMLQLSKTLSKGFPFIRTDWYVINNRLYFSEYTFYSDSGMAKFQPEEWDRKLGKWIK